ncbi:NAD-dependent epimerase/dehydratase family protein [bacterium]|nr:NAD-dependent epimerase/dehydratase family protein [bacterium]
MSRILVIGALGQIGSELTPALRQRYGADNVVAADIREAKGTPLAEDGPYEICDVTDRTRIDRLITGYKIDCIANMAALLSAVGEKVPQKCWEVNINGLVNTLEAAREHELKQVFCPSSIAVFGPNTPRDSTPQETVLEPTTMYGVTKVSGELLCHYYHLRFGVDARGLRYPGIISSETLPGGGTTDYAVEIFYKAIEDGHYDCFVREDTMLPMMYMPDCIKATMDLLAAPREKLMHRSNYNVAAISFTAGELAAEITKHLPEFTIDYKPDERQAYADSWPRTIDDRIAREEWGWTPAYDLAAMTKDMLEVLTKRQAAGALYAG